MADVSSSALIDELHALRSALHRAQATTHATSLQLHSASLQQTLTLDQLRSAEAAQSQLTAELAVLRANPVRPDEAVALEEKLQALSLAHRRLSALADGADEAVKRETGRRINEQAYRARAEMRLAKALEQLPLSPPPLPPKDGRELPDCKPSISGDASCTALLAGEKGFRPAGPDSTTIVRPEISIEEELDLERAAANETRERLIAVEVELDRRRRDDAAAAGVVARYMSFSQSSSLLLHGQLHALRIRHDASLATLLQENDKLRRELSKERKEAERTRARLGQVGEEAWIEAEGRRREIGLRLSSVAREERLMDNLRRWNSRVQAVVSKLADSDVAGDFGSAMSTTDLYASLMPVLGQASHILELDTQNSAPTEAERSIPSAQASRVYMAEELLASTMDDLRLEQKRCRLLECRLAEIEGTAELPKGAKDEVSHVVPIAIVETSPPADQSQTALADTTTLSEGVADDPLLTTLLSLPSKHRHLRTRYSDLNGALRTLLATSSPSSDDLPPELSALLIRALTRLSDVLEDARVELEIAIDDERRAVKSFRVLLTLGNEGQAAKATELVRREVEEYIEVRAKGDGSATAAALHKRADDLEYDFAALKAAWINPDSLLSSPLPPSATFPVVSTPAIRTSTQHLFPTQQFLLPPPLSSPSSGTATPQYNPLSKLGLRTLQGLCIPPPKQISHVAASNGGPSGTFRRSSFANIGRMFRDQGSSPAGPARSFSLQSTTSNGSSSAESGGGGGGWGMYRQSGLSGSTLGLQNGGSDLASPLEASERLLPGAGAEEDDEADDEVE